MPPFPAIEVPPAASPDWKKDWTLNQAWILLLYGTDLQSLLTDCRDHRSFLCPQNEQMIRKVVRCVNFYQRSGKGLLSLSSEHMYRAGWETKGS